MHAADMMFYGHETVKAAVDGLAAADWTIPGVCGIWSVKDIITHLASDEAILVEVLQTQLDPATPAPLLDAKLAGYAAFGPDGYNVREVDSRANLMVDQVWQEYEGAYHQVSELLSQFAPDDLRRTGQLPWYGAEYDLEDYLVYGYYAHKREHMAQVNLFRDHLPAARG
jgi:hypothetical protein